MVSMDEARRQADMFHRNRYSPHSLTAVRLLEGEGSPGFQEGQRRPFLFIKV
jgi:hypothetical protein